MLLTSEGRTEDTAPAVVCCGEKDSRDPGPVPCSQQTARESTYLLTSAAGRSGTLVSASPVTLLATVTANFTSSVTVFFSFYVRACRSVSSHRSLQRIFIASFSVSIIVSVVVSSITVSLIVTISFTFPQCLLHCIH